MTIRQCTLGVLGLLAALLFAGPLQAERLVSDMAVRPLKLPDEVRRGHAVGRCIPMAGAVAPDKPANRHRLGKLMPVTEFDLALFGQNRLNERAATLHKRYPTTANWDVLRDLGASYSTDMRFRF